MPDIEFVNSLKSEQERVELTRKIVGSGFYLKHGFVVVPELVKVVDPNVQVVLPREWGYRELEVAELKKEWGRVEQEFWNEVERQFPGVEKWFANTEVRLTRYGTIAAGDWLRGKENKKRIYYLRADGHLDNLAGIVVNNILLLERQKLGITWSKREALMDLVMTRPAMKKLFPHFHPVMSALARVPAKVQKTSEDYVRALGIELGRAEWEVGQGKVWLRGKAIGKELTKTEKKAIRSLVERQGELVTYDELADVLWGVGEFKTYWAINKLVGRLRSRLDRLGINKNRLESVRGQGYILS